MNYNSNMSFAEKCRQLIILHDIQDIWKDFGGFNKNFEEELVVLAKHNKPCNFHSMQDKHHVTVECGWKMDSNPDSIIFVSLSPLSIT